MNGDVKTKIIKRNGEEVTFDLDKIINAITKANEEVTKIHQMNQYQIMAIAEKVADQVANSSHAVNVEDIQNMVETGIMEMRGYEVAQKYVRYRFKRELRRKSNTTDDGILSLLDNINEEVNQEKKAGYMTVKLDGYDGPEEISIQIGSVYKGSSVRDSLDVIKFGDYTNQQDWAAVSQSINEMIDEEIVKKRIRHL